MRKNRKYTEEFKKEVLEMVAEGLRTVAQIERDLDLTPNIVYKWQERYRPQNGVLKPSEERSEQAEIRRLKCELEIIRQERDILKKPSKCSRGESSDALSIHR